MQTLVHETIVDPLTCFFGKSFDLHSNISSAFLANGVVQLNNI